jgi:hypothetical protein
MQKLKKAFMWMIFFPVFLSAYLLGAVIVFCKWLYEFKREVKEKSKLL